ncbi:MAG TPA: MATE family efflux transporter [Candidatus Rifleibacterium sp.]|nr:MATE family efflux transporter [Candidatus Rifleibacterium sp.]HQB82247.1 MATE family efflux transporter [Candidatus Rifleibacterium sp.]
MQAIDAAVYKRVFNISLPAIGGFLGLIAFDLIDIYWIEKLGTRAVAGVASAGFIVWSLYSIMQITGAGCSSLVAQFHGAGRRRRAWEAIVQSSWLSLLLAALITFLFLPYLDRPFAWMGLEPDTAALAVEYFYIILLGFPLIFLDMLSGNVFNAYGDNRISNGIMIICLIANMILDPVMMFGWWGFPAMGAAGAAWATVISHVLSLIMRGYVLRRRNYIPPLLSFFKFRTFYYRKIIRIGLPNAATSWVWSIVYPFLTRLITPFGMTPLSAVGICHRIESFPYFTSIAFGIAMTSLTGYSVGRREHDRIDGILIAGLRSATLILLPFLVIFLIFPHQLVGLLSDDPLLIAYGADYLFIIGLLEIFMAWEMVIGGIFTGLGITYPTLFITIPCTVGRVPLAWLLAYYFGMGVSGIWWAISLTTCMKGLGLLALYRYTRRKTAGFTQLNN